MDARPERFTEEVVIRERKVANSSPIYDFGTSMDESASMDEPRASSALIEAPHGYATSTGTVDNISLVESLGSGSVNIMTSANGNVGARAVQVAKQQGFEGDPCGSCGAMMLVCNGTCLKCMNCGSTSGCS